jgi:hypothetical protein
MLLELASFQLQNSQPKLLVILHYVAFLFLSFLQVVPALHSLSFPTQCSAALASTASAFPNPCAFLTHLSRYSA